MIAIVLIAIAAGCASALMFASVISGALISLLLLYLAPLPLMVAAMGWGSLCATIGGIAAAIGLGAIFGVPYCIAFAMIVALPAWWLGHLALLGRPHHNAQNETLSNIVPSRSNAAAEPPALEWYPVGRILLWTAGFAIVTTIATLLTLGADAAAITSALQRDLSQMFSGDAAALGQIQPWIDALVKIAPAATAVIVMMTLTLNLWLAAKITATSGRLNRPWPDLKATLLPPMTLVALLVAIAFCFTGGLAAMLALVIAAALAMAYALIGFAVLHTLTLALKNRTFWLSCIYAFVMGFPWLVSAVAALGLADTIFQFRQRYLQSRPPPLPAA
jgi:hypothetical protein